MWSTTQSAGYGLVIEEGHLVFRLGDGTEGAELRLAQPIEAHTWYATSAGWSGADGSAFVKLEPCGGRTDRVMPAASPAAGNKKHDAWGRGRVAGGGDAVSDRGFVGAARRHVGSLRALQWEAGTGLGVGG